MNKKEDTSNGTQTFTAYGVRAASSGLWWGQITSQNNPSIPKDSTNATIHATGRINFRFPQNVPVAGSILIPVPGSLAASPIMSSCHTDDPLKRIHLRTSKMTPPNGSCGVELRPERAECKKVFDRERAG
jgi:hypothetical protein